MGKEREGSRVGADGFEYRIRERLSEDRVDYRPRANALFEAVSSISIPAETTMVSPNNDWKIYYETYHATPNPSALNNLFRIAI